MDPLPSLPISNCKQKWFKQWVPQETILNDGKCTLLKWVTEDTMKVLEERSQLQVKEQVVEPEYQLFFLCRAENCGQIFTEASAMRKHAHSHVQFICKYEGCGKKFPDASKLKRHSLTHTAEKSIVCPIAGCGKSFASDYNLNQHLKIHSKENYHTCPYEGCNKRYVHESTLRTHIRSQHKKHLFRDVNSNASERENANPVIVMPTSQAVPFDSGRVKPTCGAATLDRPFLCPFKGCKKVYKHEYNLRLHLRREHALTSFKENENQVQASVGHYKIDTGSDKDEDATKKGITHDYSRGKLNSISKPSAVSCKYPNFAAVDLNMRITARACMGENILFTNENSQEDSELTEDAQEDTEDESHDEMMDVDTDDENEEVTEDERN